MTDVHNVLDYDVVELAFLLRSIGFQIKSYEFNKTGSSDSKDIEINIKCHASGFQTMFVLSPGKCSCPPQPSENNNSFWEVQGTSPSTPKKQITKETACTVLPDINVKTSSLARSTLLMLQQHYRNDLAADPKFSLQDNGVRPLETLETGKTLVNGRISPTFISPQNTGTADQSRSSTPVNTQNSTFESNAESQMQINIPKIKLEKPELEYAGNQQIPSLEEYSGSPNTSQGLDMTSVIFPSPQMNKADLDRDVCIIEAISKARKELDAALLHLKCNRTKDLSECSVLINTPQPVKSFSVSMNHSNKYKKRRASIGGSEVVRADVKALEQCQFLKPQSKKILNITSGTAKSKIASAIKTKNLHPDTPRPPVDLKLTVEKGIAKSKMLRTVTSTSLKAPTPTATTVTNGRTPITKQKSLISIKK